VDEAAFQRWFDGYIDAWRTYDRETVGALFAEDATYRYHPWDDPVVGRSGIVDDWLSDKDDPNSWTAEYRPWAIDEDRAVAVGVSRYLGADGKTVDREYHNVFLCRFDDEGRCREFTELFLRRSE